MKQEVRKYLSQIGKKGGKTFGPSKARTTEQARKAALVRWSKKHERREKNEA